MEKYNLPYLGEIDLNAKEEEYYDTEIDFKGQSISLDLNQDQEGEIDISKLEIIKELLENIEKYDVLNKKYIKNSFQEVGGEVKFYIQHHLEEFEKTDLAHLIDFEDKVISFEEQLLNKVKLIRIGFYLDDEVYFTTFDYSIDENITNYLIVVNLNVDGCLTNICMES